MPSAGSVAAAAHVSAVGTEGVEPLLKISESLCHNLFIGEAIVCTNHNIFPHCHCERCLVNISCKPSVVITASFDTI